MAIAVVSALAQFFDNNGDPLNGGTVTVQDAGTTSSRNIYTDTALTSAATNPIPLDSAGRPTQGMIYTAATAYKLILKNSAGTTIRTSDNIDPGVPIGSGYLAIANGGTGATSAGAALSALGGATAGELADLAADVAALAGAAASTEKTHIATGTTAQRPASPSQGDIRLNTTTVGLEAYRDAAWETVLTDNYSASTGQIALETATAFYIRPDRAKYHNGIAKAWGKIATGGTVTKGYNVTSVTKNTTGDWTVTLAGALADANYVVIAIALDASNTRTMQVASQTSSTFRLFCYNTSASLADPATGFYFQVFGEL